MSLTVKENLKQKNHKAISFWTDFENVSIAVHYDSVQGNLSPTPSVIRFEPSFPGQLQTESINVKSTFGVNIKVNKVWSSEKRIRIKKYQQLIRANTKTEIAQI